MEVGDDLSWSLQGTLEDRGRTTDMFLHSLNDILVKEPHCEQHQ